MVFFRINKIRARSAKLALQRAVKRKPYNFLSSQRVQDLKKEQLKKKSLAKVNWGVSAFKDWRAARLDYQFDHQIKATDLDDLQSLTKENLIYSLCFYIPEVTKRDTNDLYPGATLYQLVVSIQKYLHVNKICWKLVEGPEFTDVKCVLDNIMKERTSMNIGVTKKQAKLITYKIENDLWDRGFLGEDTPDKLRTTVYYGIGLGFYLHAITEHYNLRRWTPDKDSQITFEYNDKGMRCAVYREDAVTKTHDGGIKDMRRDRKEVWIHPNLENKARCYVRLIDKYRGLCPPLFKKNNFYLQSRTVLSPACWYQNQVMGEGSIGKIIGKMMEAAGYEGFYSGHSFRRSGGSRLFQAGVQRKLVKECTGHMSDAVDKYQITSDEQREVMSKILAKGPGVVLTQSSVPIQSVTGDGISHNSKKSHVNATNSTDVQSKPKKDYECSEQCPNCVQSKAQFGGLIEQIVASVNATGKAKIKIEIEISKD